jgi:hypothetical protein
LKIQKTWQPIVVKLLTTPQDLDSRLAKFNAPQTNTISHLIVHGHNKDKLLITVVSKA